MRATRHNVSCESPVKYLTKQKLNENSYNIYSESKMQCKSTKAVNFQLKVRKIPSKWYQCQKLCRCEQRVKKVLRRNDQGITTSFIFLDFPSDALRIKPMD